MRLLEQNSAGEISLTYFPDHGNSNIPPYAILSHTWGTEEVIFEDIKTVAYRNKLGYEKIRFCGDQASRDDLRYFWVDTCCIDKSSSAELQEAINRMFHWYRGAAECYVYLSDVSTRKRKASNQFSRSPWESAFRNSRWFTRGWTLQELIASKSVDFFSREGIRLGDKTSLEQIICDITGIPINALRGHPLSDFSIPERLAWIGKRKTTVAEDKAYSLFGIFDIQIPLLYGEGEEKAFNRLQEEINKASKNEQENSRSLTDLRSTDPRHDKKRIEETKGGLLADSYRWVLDNKDFKQWRDDGHGRLLWIKGDPGKGKTMLLCGIINELSASTKLIDAKANTLLSYFFCQATDSRINNASAVLRGLIFMLVDQQPTLISHVRKRYDQAGKQLFEDANAWTALTEILGSILKDPNLQNAYLVIDALDECGTTNRSQADQQSGDLSKLLGFIVQNSALPSVKWIVSSRNWPDIEERLDRAAQRVRLCLELNEKSISVAVSTYIDWKVKQLAQVKAYDDNTRMSVQRHLSLNANNTFLWVALVCQELASPKVRRRHTIAKLRAFPPGLYPLYSRMMVQISDSEDAVLCKRILAIASTVYRPITLDELAAFVDIPDGVSVNYEDLAEIIGFCGSLLTLRERTISFVHQSAKDFLLETASNDIFPPGIEHIHYTVFSRSLQVISRTLRRDVYKLRDPGFPIDKVKPPDPDPFAAARYSCIYWVDHLRGCDRKNAHNDLRDGGSIDGFLRQNYLHWLEALSLLRSMSEGVSSMLKLKGLLQTGKEASRLVDRVRDACRFILYNKWAIENSPLQVYASALVFSPGGSLIRDQYTKDKPEWIIATPTMEDSWSACLQTLEGHSGEVWSVAWSHDSTRLASASFDRTIKIWDPAIGRCISTLEGHSDRVRSVAWSHDMTRLASASDDNTVKIWDPATGQCVSTLEGHSGWVWSVAWSHSP